MVRVILDLHDERHAVLSSPRQPLVAIVRAIEDGRQLAQVTPRKPEMHTVSHHGCEHVYSPDAVREQLQFPLGLLAW
jgi:hypothetical protein